MYALPAEAAETLRARHPEFLALLRPLCELRAVECRCRDPNPAPIEGGDGGEDGAAEAAAAEAAAASCALGVAAAQLQTGLLRLREEQVVDL